MNFFDHVNEIIYSQKNIEQFNKFKDLQIDTKLQKSDSKENDCLIY